MATVQSQFEKFHNNIKLGKFDENEELREKRDKVVAKLRKGIKSVSEEHGIVCPSFTTINQGSYTMGTGIKPDNTDYDIDVAVKFSISMDDWEPLVIKGLVFDALDGHTKRVEFRRSCLTVFYQSEGEALYHVDLAIYSDLNSNGKTYLAKGKKNSAPKHVYWEESSPEDLISKIKDKHSGEDAEQFRRCIRYFKYWKNRCFGESGPTGIGLTICALSWFNPSGSDFSGNRDDLRSLKELVSKMTNQFNYTIHEGQWQKRLVMKMPVAPHNDLFEKMTEKQMETFEAKLLSLKDQLNRASDKTDPVEACEILNSIFGVQFPVPEEKATAQSQSRAIIGHNHSA